MANEVSIVCNHSNLCGESPVWDDAGGRLLWVDSDGTGIFEYDYGTKKSALVSGDVQTSSIVLAKNGLVLLGNGIWVWENGGEKRNVAAAFDGEALNFNDSIAGPDGCIYAGTYYWDERGMRKYGKLYRIGPGLKHEVLTDGIALSNGMAFSPGNSVFYHADSGMRRIYAYDFDQRTGSLRNRRVFAETGGEGIPDGITADREGYIWCAVWYAGTVCRYDPDGKLERRIDFPARQVSSVAFGGPDMDVLFVTSAKSLFRSALMPEDLDTRGELGGALYAVQPGIAGKAENRVELPLFIKE